MKDKELPGITSIKISESSNEDGTLPTYLTELLCEPFRMIKLPDNKYELVKIEDKTYYFWNEFGILSMDIEDIDIIENLKIGDKVIIE